jgi:hypothetical protein
MVGRKTPVAVGPGPEVAQALKARIEKLKRYFIQGSLTKLVEVRRDPFIAILVAGNQAYASFYRSCQSEQQGPPDGYLPNRERVIPSLYSIDLNEGNTPI